MSHVWARTRILLVPSEYESWGKAAGEAMAHGIPVIAHPTPGLVENLADAGYYANRANLDAWLERIDGLYYNPDEYSEASAAVRARARELEAITIGQLETLEARLLELASRRRATEIPA